MEEVIEPSRKLTFGMEEVQCGPKRKDFAHTLMGNGQGFFFDSPISVLDSEEFTLARKAEPRNGHKDSTQLPTGNAWSSPNKATSPERSPPDITFKTPAVNRKTVVIVSPSKATSPEVLEAFRPGSAVPIDLTPFERDSIDDSYISPVSSSLVTPETSSNLFSSSNAEMTSEENKFGFMGNTFPRTPITADERSIQIPDGETLPSVSPSPRSCATPTTPCLDGFYVQSVCPPTPVRVRTCQSNPVSQLNGLPPNHNWDNLEKTELLFCTQMKRTHSVITPGLFKFNEHFKYERLIGRSERSEVWQVANKLEAEAEEELGRLQSGSRSQGTGMKVERTAVKRSLRAFSSEADKIRLMQEISGTRDLIMSLRPHPNILEYYRCWQQESHILVQMELCSGGSVGSQLELQPNYRFSTRVLWSFIYQIASGLDHIHSSSVMHLDIKPDNIFLNSGNLERCLFKIGDFGLAVNNSTKVWEDGDGKYVAPELMKNNAEPTSAADIYSFGATVYECATGTHLVRSKTLQVQFAENCELPEEIKSLLSWMLEWEPAKRPTAAQVGSFAKDFCQPSDILMQNEPEGDSLKRTISFLTPFSNRSPSMDLIAAGRSSMDLLATCPRCGTQCLGECQMESFPEDMDTS